MAQSDQVVQNATFPAVRADINDNLAALFSQSSGPSAPVVTTAYQPWIDTSTDPAVWKIRNGTNTGWITVGVIDATGFAVGGVTPIANGGTGQTTASAAINALVPSQAGNSGKFLATDGDVVSWLTAAAGMSIQVFTSSGTFTPTANKASFLVFAIGGGGGSGSSSNTTFSSGGGGSGGTAIRLYNTTELGLNATVTVGAGGSGGAGVSGGNGGNTSFNPDGTGLTITGNGGLGTSAVSGSEGSGSSGGSTTNSQVVCNGNAGFRGSAGRTSNAGGAGGTPSFWGAGRGGDGVINSNGNAGEAGRVVVLEF